jgi:outer membrane protein assembly factor BamB
LAWKSAKGTGFLPSAIRVNDKYLHSGDRGVVTCLSLENGEEIFQKRIGGSYRASPVLADGKIYFTSLEGTVTVMDAESFEVLGVSEMGEKIGASPAVANDSLYFRGEKHLFRIGSK